MSCSSFATLGRQRARSKAPSTLATIIIAVNGDTIVAEFGDYVAENGDSKSATIVPLDMALKDNACTVCSQSVNLGWIYSGRETDTLCLVMLDKLN